MPKFKFFQDGKITVWNRIRFTVEAENEEEAIRLLKLNRRERISALADKDDRFKILNSEILYGSQKNMEPENNGNEATIGFYFGDKDAAIDLICTNDTEPLLMNIVPPRLPRNLRGRDSFEYRGCRFIPVCKMNDLKGCETFVKASSHLVSIKGDRLFRFNNYDKDTNWSQENFLSQDNTLSDIFYCIEAGKYFCPGKNELFVFNHPDLEMPEDPLAENRK